MPFSSWTFLLLFLPVVLIGFFLLPIKYRNAFLLISSLFFYAWGQPWHLLVMLVVILLNYMLGMAIDNRREYGQRLLVIAVAVNLCILGWYKYANFIINSLNEWHLAQLEPLNVVLPIGISFYTFQALSYTIDVYRRAVPVQKNIFKLALYVALFPQLIAGPIVKYREIMEYLDNRLVSMDDTVAGLRRFMVGLAKKVIIADNMGDLADAVFAAGPENIGVQVAWAGAAAYSLQIFFDFSGYSDMAIGLGRTFGFRFAENFNYPYVAASVTEFWRRWHISLSTWFKDYVYIPLGGNRCSAWRNALNLLIVFFLTGLWHGANWTFVVWGLWHGAFLMLEKYLFFRNGELKEGVTAFSKRVWVQGLCHVYTVLIFMMGWVIFRGESLSYGMGYFAALFGLGDKNMILFGLQYYLNWKIILAGIGGLILCYPWKFSLIAREEDSFCVMAIKDILVWGLFFISLIFLTVGTYNPFIYFRF